MPVDETFRAIELIESGRYPFDKMHTLSIHLAIVPGAPRVTLPPPR